MQQDLSSRVAYLQGLCNGMNLDTESNEGKILSSIVNVLEDVAGALDEMEKAHSDIEDYMETIDEDLLSLEDTIYNGNEEFEEELPEDYLETTCPGCGETVCFESGLLSSDDTIEITCPSCEEVVFTSDEGEYITDGSEEIERTEQPKVQA